MFGPKDKTEEIINLIWNKEVYYLVAASNDAPTKKEVKEIASSFGISVPADYIAHATGYWGSPYLEVREEYWPRHKVYDVGPFWSFLYGVFVYAYSEEAPEWMQIKVAAQEFKEMGSNSHGLILQLLECQVVLFLAVDVYPCKYNLVGSLCGMVMEGVEDGGEGVHCCLQEVLMRGCNSWALIPHVSWPRHETVRVQD